MAAQAGQTYATHRQRSPWWLVAFFTSAIALAMMAILIFNQPALFTLGLLLMSIAVVTTVMLVRGYALRLQDRIIRLEMQTRCGRLGLDPVGAGLTLRQIIALRFASDAELPALIERARSEQLSPDQIKRAVTSWQGDYHRV